MAAEFHEPDTYTHGHQASVLRSHTWRTIENSAAYLAPHLRPEHRLLDVGCGPGTISAEFATRVREVVAIDLSGEVVAKAQAHANSLGLTNVDFGVGDTYSLEFDDDSFDVVHAHQVLQHVTRPVDAITEMMRVTRPGGIVAVRDADYSAMFWAPLDPVMDQWREMYLSVARRNQAEPDAGRWLRTWAQQAGASDIAVSSDIWTFADDADRNWWGNLWADRVVDSALAVQAAQYEVCSKDDLVQFSRAWRAWIQAPGAYFGVPHVELIITV